MNASNLLVTISAANLAALIFFAVRLGERIGKAESTQEDHGRRLGIVEPKLDLLGTNVAVLQGRQLGRRDYDPKISQ